MSAFGIKPKKAPTLAQASKLAGNASPRQPSIKIGTPATVSLAPAYLLKWSAE